jgi:predicted DNA-binding transcriptional regulator
MPRVKYMWRVYDLIRERGCVAWKVVVDTLAREFNLETKKAERAATSSLKALLKRNLIEKRGYGTYCIARGDSPNFYSSRGGN